MNRALSSIQPNATPDLKHCSQGGTRPPLPPLAPPPAVRVQDTNTEQNDPNLGSVITRIESLMESFVNALAACQELSIALIRRPSRRLASPRTENVRFPGKTVQEARKFARILLILQLSHDALVSGTILTKRHIFYQHQDLFEKQAQVDELVDDIALTLGIGREDLNIVAASKGVLLGPLFIYLKDGSCLDPISGDLGIPIPITKSISSINLNHLNWILVVEKDAKGYPDLTTRTFLSLIQTTNPRLPILALMDFDPDGVSIFKCYRYGSQKLSHEAGACVHGMRWLGINSGQLIYNSATNPSAQTDNARHGPKEQASEDATAMSRVLISSIYCEDPITYLSLRDRKTANALLKSICDVADTLDRAEVRREVHLMLVLSVKAEIEWLDDCGNLNHWLNNAISLSLACY
ncbi:Spo11/DNA topoisomerase VI subunit A [Mariannaea sp. PMI_226]|nr:Spo11/DNA topoisomerase VI subunit A [Mariannaea sp. PMI_226]